MNILEKIVADKRKFVEAQKQQVPSSQLEKMPHFERTCSPFDQALRENAVGVIAEFKRKSPSKQAINLEAESTGVVPFYEKAGAAASSILTDGPYFQGFNADVLAVRGEVQMPLLRKDFMVDEYQVLEAKAIGADVILLLANVLTPAEIKTLGTLAQTLGMQTLLEVRDKEELDNTLGEWVNVVGVNNRNLKTFSQNIDQSLQLAEHIPAEFLRISESGLSEASSIVKLRQAGYEGFLIGETFMKTTDPGKACADFIQEVMTQLNTVSDAH